LAHAVAPPVIRPGDGTGARALFLIETGGKQDEIAMACVIGKIDALIARRSGAAPDWPHAGNPARQDGQKRTENRLHLMADQFPHVRAPTPMARLMALRPAE